MAFFKFRKGEGESVAKKPTPSESVEAMRRRARQRLIGASVLVLAGVIGFPLLFDTQPRPVSVDIPIEIPDRQKAAPLSVPAETAARSEQGAAPGSASASARSEAAAPVKPVEPAPVAEAPAPPAPAPAPPPTAAAPAPAPAPATKPEPRATAADEAARARALLEGKPVQAGDDRFVVQVGAFAEAAKAREVRSKLERAGVKTYVHVAETKDGPRIRVRVGPFTSRAEADRTVQKIKGLDLPAAVLTL